MLIIAIVIAKNEADNIAQCVRSAAAFGCSDVVLVDTGSTDGTIEAAAAALSDQPAILHAFSHQWAGFSDARNRALDEALALAQDPANTLALVLDADEHLEGPPASAFDLSGPHGSYWLREAMGAITYNRPRLLRLSVPWRCFGRVHEYWAAPGHTGKGEIMDGLWLCSHGGDGRATPAKYERYLELLRLDEQDGVDPSRTAFYLAQTLAILGRHVDCVEYARRRIALGGWEEETYATRLLLIDALWTLDEHAAYLAACEATVLRRDRPEGAWRLARLLRIAGRFADAVRVAQAALIDVQVWRTTDTLFVDSSVIPRLLPEEIAVSAWHAAAAMPVSQAKLQLLTVGRQHATQLLTPTGLDDEQWRLRGEELLSSYGA